MKIGIYCKNKSKLFENGALSQVLFVYQLINEINNFTCELFSNMFCKNQIFPGIDIQYIGEKNKLSKSLLNLDILIFLSHVIVDEDILKQLKKNKVKIAYYNCGNLYYTFQEDLIFGQHNLLVKNYQFHFYDCLWCIPNYTKNLPFYQSFMGIKDVNTINYVWNNNLLDNFMKQINYSLFYDNNINKSKTKFIIICEPNIQLTKTCMVPILICNDLYKNGYKDIKVICLSKPTKHPDKFNNFISRLDIFKDKRLELHGRIYFFEIIRQLKTQGIDLYILSHHKDNPLNFLHLETLYLKYPLIHNTKNYKKAGYYYKTIPEAVKQLQYAFENHCSSNQLQKYNEETRKVLFRFSPYNEENQKNYKTLIENIVVKNNLNQLNIIYEDNLSQLFKKYNITNVEGNIFCNEQKTQYIKNIIEENNIKNILEIGFNAGHSSYLFLNINDNINVTSFDLGIHKYVNLVKKDIFEKNFPNRHKLILGNSLQTLPNFIKENNDITFDLIFIDGGHTYDVAFSDIMNSLKISNNETILILDDIYDPRVMNAYKDIKQQNLIKEVDIIKYDIKYSFLISKVEYNDGIVIFKKVDDNNKIKENITFAIKDKINNDKTQLVIKPTHGFANRLKFLASSYILAKQLNLELIIYWEATEECNIDFLDVFNENEFTTITKEEYDHKTTNHNFIKYNHNVHIKLKINEIVQNIQNCSGFMIEGGHEFYQPNLVKEYLHEKHLFYNSLYNKFNTSITNQILQINHLLPNEYIGIHYRYFIPKYDKYDGNNVKFTTNSPIGKFYEVIKNIQNIETKFNNYDKLPLIVFSNNNKIYQDFKTTFPNKSILSISFNKNQIMEERNNKENMIKSIIDLIILSKSKVIIGSYFSSFSDEACHFNNISKVIPLNDELVKQNTKLNSNYHCLGFKYDDKYNIGMLNN